MESLWTEQQVAQYIGRAVSSLQKDRLHGVGVPFVKLGRLVRYRPEDVRSYVNARIVQSTSDLAGKA